MSRDVPRAAHERLVLQLADERDAAVKRAMAAEAQLDRVAQVIESADRTISEAEMIDLILAVLSPLEPFDD